MLGVRKASVALVAAVFSAGFAQLAMNREGNLSSRPTTKDPAKRETVEEWRDPEDVRAAGVIQGVLPK
jgi:hypothetical protein